MVDADGTDLRRLPLHGYRRRLGLVPQESHLFSGTVTENIAYGRPEATTDEVAAAAAAVGADAFIGALPDGYAAPVGERGGSLSAGERQLLALARARLVDPAVLLLDEATSSLDLTSEERMNRYRDAVDAANGVEELVQVASRIYREDRDSGHVAVISQMVAGSLARPELAKGVLERIEPWVDFCDRAIRKVIAGSPLEDALPVRELAYGLVSFYLGANLLTHLGGAPRTEALFERAEALAPTLASIIPR